MSNSAAHKPSDLEAQYQGQTRDAGGYQYWTTSAEDEAAVDDRERFAKGPGDGKKRKAKRKVPKLPKGLISGTFKKLLGLLFLSGIVLFGYALFSYLQVTDSAGERASTAEADAIVVMGESADATVSDGEATYVLRERLDHAFNLWEDEVAPFIVLTGEEESRAGRAHLVERGVPDSALVLIGEGDDGWEQLNASQGTLTALAEANRPDVEELQVEGVERPVPATKVVLVAESFQTHRLLDIASGLGLEAYASPTVVQGSFGDSASEAFKVGVARFIGYDKLNELSEEDEAESMSEDEMSEDEMSDDEAMEDDEG